jgi:diacylglycerol kinase family enzyme
MRALLVVNPRATAAGRVRWEDVARALAPATELEVVQTRYRGHATHYAQAAASSGTGLVVTLGGDGTANEAANGLLRARAVAIGRPAPPGRHGAPGPATHANGDELGERIGGQAGQAPAATAAPSRPADGTAPEATAPGATAPGATAPGATAPGRAALPHGTALPPGTALAPLPGGHANVFARALGLPTDPVRAASQVAAAVSTGTSRVIGVGLAGDRFFCVNAGLGLDAEVVRRVEGLRTGRQPASAALYVWATVRQFYGATDRREPALSLALPGRAAVDSLFCGIVSNTADWTYLGPRALRASPLASFATGLDLFALKKLTSVGTISALRQMLSGDGRPPAGRHILTLHDEAAFTLRARRPIAFQVDGEYMGEREMVPFSAIPAALTIVA